MPGPTAHVGSGAGVVAVTGASGFIGSQILARLDQSGQPSRALIREKRNRTVRVPASTEIVPGSLNDSDAIQRLLAGAQTCIHAAGATKSIDMSGFYATNVVGTYDMAARAVAAGVEHFIYVSSQAARAPDISDYAASKAASEAALNTLRSRMKITIIRPPAVIGPGDPMLKPMFDLLRAGWLPAPAEPRSRQRVFAVISVRDLADQIVASARAPDANAAVIEPCSVPATNWQEVGRAVGEVLGRKIRILPLWPGLMSGVGCLADGVARLTRRPMPISQSKIRELLAADWTYDHPARDAMSLKQIFEACFNDSGR